MYNSTYYYSYIFPATLLHMVSGYPSLSFLLYVIAICLCYSSYRVTLVFFCFSLLLRWMSEMSVPFVCRITRFTLCAYWFTKRWCCLFTKAAWWWLLLGGKAWANSAIQYHYTTTSHLFMMLSVPPVGTASKVFVLLIIIICLPNLATLITNSMQTRFYRCPQHVPAIHTNIRIWDGKHSEFF